MRRWALVFDAEPSSSTPGVALATCSFVALVRRADGTPAVLKLGLPDMESLHELPGLLFWRAGPVVRVLEAEPDAFLLERCLPGAPLAAQPEPLQDQVIASLLRRLWLTPPAGHPFRPLLEMAKAWTDSALASRTSWPDAGLARAGLERFVALAAPRPDDVLLTTDLHAGNVLAASREPWLVIDPKPFVGDPAYDATQHLLNCVRRLAEDPSGIVTSFAALLGVSSARVRDWLFARLITSAMSASNSGSSVMGMDVTQALKLARKLENMLV
jgi:streptomycin 6-kinase